MAGDQEHLLASGALNPKIGRVRVQVLYADEQKTANRIATVDPEAGVRRISGGTGREREREGLRSLNTQDCAALGR